MPQCPFCKSEVSGGAKFCAGCGKAIPVAGYCPSCGAKLLPGMKFCDQCGFKVVKPEGKTEKTESEQIPEATEEEKGVEDFKEEKTQEAGEARLCPECGIEISKDEEVCEICRDETTVIFKIKKESDKAIPENLCPGCNREILPDKNFCPFCGYRLIEEKTLRVYEEKIDKDEKTLKITEKEKDLSEEVKTVPDKAEPDFNKTPPEEASPEEDLSGSTMALDKVLKEDHTVRAVTEEETGEDTTEVLTLLSDKTSGKEPEEIKEEDLSGSTMALDKVLKEDHTVRAVTGEETGAASDFNKTPPEEASPEEDLSGSTMALDKVLKEEHAVRTVTVEETGEDTIEVLTLLSDKTSDKESEGIKAEETPEGSTVSLDEIPKEAVEEICEEKVKELKPEAIEKQKAGSVEIISRQVLPVLLILCLMSGIFLVIRSFNQRNTFAVNTPTPSLKEPLTPVSEITPSGDETPVEVADASSEPNTLPTEEPAKNTPVTLPTSIPSPTQIPAVIPTPVPTAVPTVAAAYNPPVPVYNNYNNEPEDDYKPTPAAVPTEISYVDVKRTYCNEYIRNVIQPLYSAGKYKEAIDECHLLISHEKNYYVNYLWMANCLLAYGALDEAKYYIDMAWKLEYNERNRIDYGNSESSKLYDRYRELGGRE